MDAQQSLTRYLLKRIARGVSYDEATQSFGLNMRVLTPALRDDVIAEGSRWGLSPRACSEIIDQVTNWVDSYSQVNDKTVQSIDVRELPPGQIVTLSGDSVTYGSWDLRLIYLTESREGTASPVTPRFMILRCSKLSLRPDDILDLCGNSYIGCGHRAVFSVWRSGKRYPDQNHYFATDRIGTITKECPSLVHTTIDALRRFTCDEEQASRHPQTVGGERLTMGLNPMDLLMHGYCHTSPIVAHFAADGTASFEPNPGRPLQPSPLRDLVLGLDQSLTRVTVKAKARKRGRLILNLENQRVELITPAQCSVTKQN